MGQLNMDLYVRNLKIRYQKADKETKKQILDEFCETSGYHRKHVIRLLTRKSLGKKSETRGCKKKYSPEELLTPLKNIWFATDQMCGKRLKIAMPLWLPHYESAYGTLSIETQNQLLEMSSATIDRILGAIRARYPRRLVGTKPGTLLKQHVPIKTNQWDENRPGFVEGDTVAHCGTSLSGNFIWSVTVTDIYSGWTENGAMWNKGAYGALEQIRLIEERLPFSLLGWDSDNGGEFLNYHLLNYFQKRETPVQFTRSRPYHSGDNAHVEQKNWTHVRQLFGYYRFTDQRMVSLMNDLYRHEWALLHNYFYPAMKLEEKVRIKSKVKKVHRPPQTPYQRLIDSSHISIEQKTQLKNTFHSLNPFTLRAIIEKKLEKIFSYVHKKRVKF